MDRIRIAFENKIKIVPYGLVYDNHKDAYVLIHGHTLNPVLITIYNARWQQFKDEIKEEMSIANESGASKFSNLNMLDILARLKKEVRETEIELYGRPKDEGPDYKEGMAHAEIMAELCNTVISKCTSMIERIERLEDI